MKKILFALGATVLMATGAFAQAKKIVADKIIGVVGDRIILQSDVQNAIADASRQGQQVPENASCQILEQALISKVMMLQAEKDSLEVTEEDVEAELEMRVRSFIQQFGTQQALEEVAGKTVFQIKEDARASVKERKLAEAMQKKIMDGVKITPTEVRAYFDKIPKDSLPFYESEYELGQIVLYPKASRDMELYVIDELNNYKRQIAAKLTSFDQLARRNSEDPGSKERGGQYQINRNEKTWDPAFLNGAFRLKDGEISPVIKSKFGYHIIQMIQRNGDEAIVAHILRIPPVTDIEIAGSTAKLDSIRNLLVKGEVAFPVAAGKFTEDETAKFSGPFITGGRTGSSFVTIDELDKDIVTELEKLKVGDYSQPQTFTDPRGKKGVRLLYLRARTEPHRMNIKEDYDKISSLALEEKKYKTLETWLDKRIPAYYIMVDANAAGGTCPQLDKWLSRSTANR
ncbi:periplasmic chaperone for outer membrane proteins SurA [Cnuella takakiae]|uniref:Periplasmic chaperone for outer membrane proteins SurA n=1 Tax=Cnuella takakiae TaxID=1302690 RepID=A0A1M4ZIF2_9BACT|nr:peptidylprolyl isomerase [Cnuella takakiae]OLY94201.1 peptidylprolyl isomerase [Cnuella takakiae]SHF17823.1 periplasmic chaperone for outer membrane proteins SurA [Cnuella takakiae]